MSLGKQSFRRIITSLKSSHAAGLIVHKIDRGVRNLADWVQLGELIDRADATR